MCLQKLKNVYLSLREKYLFLAVEKMKKLYMDLLHPHRVPWNETTESLSRFDDGSLGNRLYIFLKNSQLVLQPKYESHDVFHIISGYGIGIMNEARLFFFLFGNGKRSVSIIGSMIVALIFIPEGWKTFYRDYQRGKTYHSIKAINFENFLHIKMDLLQSYLRKTI